MMATCRPASAISSNRRRQSSASASVTKRCGQYVTAFVPMRMFWTWSNSGASSGSMYFRSIFVRMIIGSPPVNSTSVMSRMRPEIAEQVIGLRRLELDVLQPHELRPPEAVGAVGMAGLPRRGKEQQGLAVLVLQPRKPLPVEHRDVMGELSCRMGIEALPDPVHGGGQSRPVADVQ